MAEQSKSEQIINYYTKQYTPDIRGGFLQSVGDRKENCCQALDMPHWYRGPSYPWLIGTGKVPLEVNTFKRGISTHDK
jgi:hypothetical protein